MRLMMIRIKTTTRRSRMIKWKTCTIQERMYVFNDNTWTRLNNIWIAIEEREKWRIKGNFRLLSGSNSCVFRVVVLLQVWTSIVIANFFGCATTRGLSRSIQQTTVLYNTLVRHPGDMWCGTDYSSSEVYSICAATCDDEVWLVPRWY